MSLVPREMARAAPFPHIEKMDFSKRPVLDGVRHGTTNGYTRGCRCKPCTVWHTVVAREREYHEPGTGRNGTKVYQPISVSAVGTQRRLRALVWLGYTMYEIAEVTGVNRSTLNNYLNGESELIRNLDVIGLVKAVYRDRITRNPPNTREARKARKRAREFGWHGPAAWGHDIDDPMAQPDVFVRNGVPSDENNLIDIDASDIMDIVTNNNIAINES